MLLLLQEGPTATSAAHAPITISGSWLTSELLEKHGSRSLWYFFEDQVHQLPETAEAIWSRAGSYTWAETYANSCRYGQFFLQNGVKAGELVSFYLTNQPEFMFAFLGTWSVGSAPALINHHLAGDALVHCLKVAGGKLLLVDEDSEARERIEAVRDRIEGELGMTIKILDTQLKGELMRLEPKRPEDELRAGVTPTFPIFLFYTRYVLSFTNTKTSANSVVAQLVTPKRALLRLSELPVSLLDALKPWA